MVGAIGSFLDTVYSNDFRMRGAGLKFLFVSVVEMHSHVWPMIAHGEYRQLVLNLCPISSNSVFGHALAFTV